ncbi:hypothetical protein EYW93_22755 [Escherichia coli]|nr:hypothetical protein [Escherichia coli]
MVCNPLFHFSDFLTPLCLHMVYLNGECPNEWSCPPPAYGVSILLILICSGLLIAGVLLRKFFRK